MAKKIIVLIAIVLILVAGGVFWWQKEKIGNYLEQREIKSVFAPAKNYMIHESSQGKFIENKKEGLKFMVPEGWKEELGVDMFGYTSKSKVLSYSPDYNLSPPQGCAIEIEIIRMEKQKEGFLVKGTDEIRKYIKEIKEAKLENEDSPYKVIHLNSHEALKEDLGKFIKVYLPNRNKVYSFYFVQNSISKECLDKFNKFLDTVSID